MEYGINNYDITKIEFPLSDLNNQERYFIRYFQTREYYGGCNLTDGGDGIRGYKFSEDSKRKMSTPKSGKSLGDLNPELSKEWHLTKNGDLTSFDVCPNSHKKVWWICKICGYEWISNINNRNNGNNCPYCFGKKVNNENNLAIKNSELAKEWDYERNKDSSPYDFCSNSTKKVWWICKICGYEWISNINNRNNGNNCPECKRKKQKNEGHPSAKSYKLISPNNEIFIIKGTLKKFCKENDLSYDIIQDMLHKRYYKDNHKGWKIEYFTEDEYKNYLNN